MKSTVVMVDGHTAVRQMLCAILAPDFQIVAEAGSGVEAMDVFRTVVPHLVIMDVQLPNVSGISILRHLRKQKGGNPRVLVFSGTKNERLVGEVLDERPHGYVHKKNSLGVLRTAIEAVSAGGNYYCPFASDIMDRRRYRAASGWNRLSEREEMILQLVAEGCSSKEVAARLSLATKTIEHYRAQLMQKLDLRDVTAITRYAISRGLVQVD